MPLLMLREDIALFKKEEYVNQNNILIEMDNKPIMYCKVIAIIVLNLKKMKMVKLLVKVVKREIF